MEKKYLYITAIVIIIIVIIYIYKNKKQSNNNKQEENLEENLEKFKEDQKKFEKMIMTPPVKLEEIRKDVLQDNNKLNSFKLVVNRASELGAEWAKQEKEQDWYKNTPKIKDIKLNQEETTTQKETNEE
jgi:hypothetical protein